MMTGHALMRRALIALLLAISIGLSIGIGIGDVRAQEPAQNPDAAPSGGPSPAPLPAPSSASSPPSSPVSDPAVVTPEASTAAPSAVDPGKPAGGEPPRLSEAEIASTIGLLEDPAARDAFLARLKALQASMHELQPGEQGSAQTFIDNVTGTVNQRVQKVVDTVKAVFQSIEALPNFADWLAFQVNNDYRRAFWRAVLWGVGLMLGCGLVLATMLTWLVRRYTSRVRLNPAHGPGRRALRRLWTCLLDILPAVGFFLAGYIVLRALPLAKVTIEVGTLGVLCLALGHVIWMVTHHALAPEDAEWRWFKISDRNALDLRRFIRGAGFLTLDGYFVLVAAALLGLPPSLNTVLSHILFIVVCLWTTVWLFRHRLAIEHVIRRLASSRRAFLRDVLPWDMLATNGFLLGVGLVWLYYLIWAIDVPGGLQFLLVATAGTVLVAAILQFFLLALHRFQSRLLKPTPEEAAEGGDVSPSRAGNAVIFAILSLAMRVLAVLVVLQLWGLDILGWLRSPGGSFVAERALRIAIILAVAVVLWIGLDRAILRYLTARDASGNIKHSNRSLTLANIGRNVVLVVLGLFAAATVLTEIGVDTGPLLAGAGVAGLALGFGSQALVKDIITGLFILLGDTMRVGDVVNLGGQMGAVETMSMRAVVLRAYDGSVMTIPYGSITTIANMTKDFSFAVFRLSVSLKDDPDRAIAILREVDEEMRGEWPYRRIILAPLEIAGVDRFGEWAVEVLARLKVRPGDQWRISREFNRRLKKRLDANGIEIPFPHQTVYYRDGDGPGPIGLAGREEQGKAMKQE